MIRVDLKGKYLGGMVGSALGDAVGEIAFTYPQRATLSAYLDQNSEFGYTDDTAMAVGLAESMIERGEIEQEHLGETFRLNFEREPWRGYASGPPTIFSLVKEHGIPYPEAARTIFNGNGSLGNGAAMRVTPVGLLYYKAPDLYHQVCRSAEVTHAHPVGMDGAAVQARAVAFAVTLDPKKAFPVDTFIQKLIDFARTSEIETKMSLVKKLIAEGISPGPAADRLGRSVAVHESMPFALYSFLKYPQSFEQCLFCAILNGGDRDTLGAMACAVSGAYLGIEAIPSVWRQKLENRAYIEQLALRLSEIGEGSG